MNVSTNEIMEETNNKPVTKIIGRYCSQCGKYTEDQGKYCGFCGCLMEFDKEQIIQEPMGREESQVIKRKSNLSKMIVIALIVCILSGAAIFAILEFSSENSDLNVSEKEFKEIAQNTKFDEVTEATKNEKADFNLENGDQRASDTENPEKVLVNEDSSQKIPEYEMKQEDLETQEIVKEIDQKENTQGNYEPFYGIWCFASKKQSEALNAASVVSQKGFDGQVFVTTNWSNLIDEKWYAVSAGVYSTKEEAEAVLAEVQSIYSDAYIKYSGDWQG